MSVPVVAIDGPSASGKGTVAWQVAQTLGLHYLESGALYRLVGLLSLRRGLQPGDARAIAQIALELEVGFQGERILYFGQDVTDEVHSEASGARASEVAAIADVRTALLERQRAFRRAPGLVAEGRDMGTVVFPDALLKVFLTATVAARAERRYKQLIAKGIRANLRTLSRDLEERDARDATRTVAPLAIAPDAVQLDSTNLPIEAVVGRIVGWYRERAARATR